MSTIKATTLSNLAGSKTVPTDTVVDGSAKAWVNFNGTGTVAIRRAFNVSSITDNGTGDYTVNFTNAMADANYCANLSGSSNNTTTMTIYENAFANRSASLIAIATVASSTGVLFDSDSVNVSINS